MTKKIGILGGGQLGRMFLQSAYNFPYEYYVLDADGAPCQALAEHFHVGDFLDYDDVVAFGQKVDVIGIEIENVNTQALATLQKQGKTVIPSADTLTIIKDKGLQKEHYTKHHIKTVDYYLIDGKSDLNMQKIALPFVQKLRTGGYDGKGVQVIKQESDLERLWDAPSVIERLAPIAKELAVMVVKGQQEEYAIYPTVEMVFDPKLNLVDYLFSPADISNEQQKAAIGLAQAVADSFDGLGVFAVELFIDTEGETWVNETAPRVHNSGHHTIEATGCSQFEQMLRVLAGLPLGSTTLSESGAMINLLGAEGYRGEARVEGLEALVQKDKVSLHWYGKKQTLPGRKMGHVTILGERPLVEKTIAEIKSQVKIISE